MNKQIKNVYEGTLDAKGIRIAIACARFNEFFVSKLLEGAVDAIVRHGGKTEDIDVAWVPGSYELPIAVQKFLATKKYDAVYSRGNYRPMHRRKIPHLPRAVSARAKAGFWPG